MKLVKFQIAITSIVFGLTLGASLSKAQTVCTSVPAGSPNAAVEACESPSSYHFKISGDEFEFDKKSYQSQLRSLLMSWINQTYLVNEPLSLSTVDLWLSVPELNPSATQMRAVVKTSRENFVFFISLHPQEWLASELSVGILAQGENYPESYGYRAGSILAKKNSEADEDRFTNLLGENGAYNVKAFSQNWYQADSKVFFETEVIGRIQNQEESNHFVANIQTNEIVEWIALRERVFSFRLVTSP